MITAVSRLTDDQLAASKSLIAAVQNADGTARVPYLSNMLNFDPTMPAFFLAYEEDQLVGLLSVYADDEEAELAILVHPDHRQKGIARQLFKTFQAETTSYPITEVTFWTERVFLEKNPCLPKHWGLVENPDRDTWLVRERTSYPLSSRKDIVFDQATLENSEAIATFQSQVFDNSYDVSLRYAREAIGDPDSLLYLLQKGEEVIASCTVDVSSDYNYLYGLAVLPSHQGQGYGTYLVQSIVNTLIEQNDKAFQIAVEDDNVGAMRLYEKIGFAEQTQIIYLDYPQGG
ncbi:GNAT family N-acetyltransferase [Streptococcus moroccensis]|uniref:Ribosomal protein S18 acetylase RimI-like enzyme n=1 Tax=Streptococcus moroccensis TaxID=1451356 RepID=A0ABT9YRK8_9STRE|nr:GNAT family N-acetyltransferase [Streptococcus moroccensis]MDQ0222405.1 ribosomal protein S18 acetylase RimI-like enzyme [Streptococcus moroccensis]